MLYSKIQHIKTAFKELEPKNFVARRTQNLKYHILDNHFHIHKQSELQHEKQF